MSPNNCAAAQIRQLGLVAYTESLLAMQHFTAQRDAATADEIWLCEHPAVFTQGQAGKPEHLLLAGHIPLIASNRGGQITFHGPGQVVAYALIDLKRAGYFVKEYVYRIEEAVLKTLSHVGVTGHRVAGAPGIYVRPDAPFEHARLPSRPQHGQRAATADFSGLAKIAALGVKVSRGCAYHGVALNVCMDLSPFEHINPCGYAGLATTDLFTIGVQVSWQEVADVLGSKLATSLMP
ncbi:MAG: lipoyl(octanoyl) transferase LipB [Betaproteobacteria bacterium]|nr:lipoyl(octanoyl) transferase LipB [Betaproteobacteria bacterium]